MINPKIDVLDRLDKDKMYINKCFECDELKMQVWKLQNQLLICEEAYMSLLRDYTKLKEDNKQYKKDIKKAIELLDWFIS